MYRVEDGLAIINELNSYLIITMKRGRLTVLYLGVYIIEAHVFKPDGKQETIIEDFVKTEIVRGKLIPYIKKLIEKKEGERHG